ncbi:MAG: DNA-binding protein [Candidatus Eisenbacteria bacterium]|nr:DNA-binding protein [Candidatus Eisenbacteria bacterium]
MTVEQMPNAEIAGLLERVAGLLEADGESPFRVRSYRRAARRIRENECSITRLALEGGRERLQEIPGIGEALAGAIEEIAETGRLGLLQRLESQQTPRRTLARVPGIGPKLAARIHDELGVESLEALERAAHNERLARVPGIGERRLAGIRDALAGMLSRAGARRARERQRTADDGEGSSRSPATAPKPPVGLLLEIDAEYRRKADADELRRIAPRRFNPSGEAWLPIMEVERQDWRFTALFSNTARAHQRGKTHDWVVIYFRPADDSRRQSQCTVITAELGDLRGRRIVRGRERACRAYYANRGGRRMPEDAAAR